MNLRLELANIINSFSPGDGVHETPLSGVYCIKFSHLDRRMKQYWHASLCIVAQGCIEIILNRETYCYNGVHYIASLIDLPVTSRLIAATPEQPFLCLKIEFDSLALSEVVAQIEKDFSKEAKKPLRAMFIEKASDQMLEAAIRLGKLFQAPEDAPFLEPLVIKEILYYLMKGPDGQAFRQFVRSGSTMYKISQAIYTLNAKLSEDADITSLAKATNMSRSAFFKRFKEVTGMSPIQYQKRLRLLEARRLMINDGETAENSAFKVGYNSASQFNREYSRLFGNSPLRDVIKIKQNGNTYQIL
jgi:AraC-type DNA-binding domain-containing proteins